MYPHLSSLLLTFLSVVAQQQWMPALEESSMMGRRAKLLKPRSWGAADIRLFSISPSVSLYPSAVFYPHFMLSYSVCLLPSPQSVLLPIPVLLAVLFLLFLILFLLCALLFQFSSSYLFFSAAYTGRLLQALTGCAENLYNLFSRDYMQSSSFIAAALWWLLTNFVTFE